MVISFGMNQESSDRMAQHVSDRLCSLPSREQTSFVRIPDFDYPNLSTVLGMTDLPIDNEEFYTKVKDHGQVPNIEEGSEEYYKFTLRRIFRNREATRRYISPGRKFLEEVSSALRIYSSTQLGRSLRSNMGILELMENSSLPFSILGKFEMHSYANPEQELYNMTMPILVIPDVADNQLVQHWEDQNTRFTREAGIIGQIFGGRNIPRREYVKGISAVA